MPNLACGAGASLTVISELTGDASLFAAIARHFFLSFSRLCEDLLVRQRHRYAWCLRRSALWIMGPGDVRR